MLRYNLSSAVIGAGLVFIPMTCAKAESFTARMTGFNETPAILSGGSGTFELDLDTNAKTARYTLTYSGLSAPVTQGHIHFSKKHVAGGIIVWLCQSAANPGPAGTPTCPSGDGTVSGSITPGSIVAVPAQLVPAGDFDALTDALFTKSAYANVHTTAAPAGEIRGQIRSSETDDE
jgi:CHRD domain